MAPETLFECVFGTDFAINLRQRRPIFETNQRFYQPEARELMKTNEDMRAAARARLRDAAQIAYHAAMWTQVIALSSGASFGAIARWQLGLWLNSGHPHQIPWGTWAANAIGAYLIGLGVTLLQNHPQLDPAWRLLLITGFLGALTTFSTFSIETVSLFSLGKPGLAIANAFMNLAGSLLLTWLGLLTGEWWVESHRIS